MKLKTQVTEVVKTSNATDYDAIKLKFKQKFINKAIS